MSIKEKFAKNLQDNISTIPKTEATNRQKKSRTPLLRPSGPICFTGAGPYPRHRLNAIAREAGYEPENRVRSNTAYLITDDPNRQTVKRRTAARLGIPIISYNQFLASLEY